MKVAIVSANCGSFDSPVPHVPQSIPVDYYLFDDTNFPPRRCAMTPRLQGRLVKCFAWQMIPEPYDIYIWVDSSLSMTNPEAAKWFIDQMGWADMAFFKHPDRNTIQEEADFIKSKIAAGNKYLCSRYENELIDEQLDEIHEDKEFVDDLLIASSAFVYRNEEVVRDMMKEWWYWTSRYHTIDQIGLSIALHKSNCAVRIIQEHYMHNDYLTYNRKRGKHNG